MKIIQIETAALSKTVITTWLSSLRENASCDKSHFAVAAIIEVPLNDNRYAYVGGVNIENHEHNSLTIHAEANAIATAQSYLGGNIKLSKIWIMGAPKEITAESDHPMADNLVGPCGSCRQQILSNSAANAEVYSVTCHGKIGEPTQLDYLLPLAFSEHNLNLPSEQNKKIVSNDRNALFKIPTPLDFINKQELTRIEKFNFLLSLTPHIVDAAFCTSAITKLIIKFSNGFFVPGVLTQDVAFLTTDAVFAAIGQAISQFNAKNLVIEEMVMFGNTTSIGSLLTGSEITAIAHFAKKDIPILYYSQNGTQIQTTFTECIEMKNANMIKLLSSPKPEHP